MMKTPVTPRLARLAAGAGLLIALSGMLAAPGPASAAGGTGWLRLAHLSPNTPPVDVYLYSFGNPHAMIVLHHVGYGAVSPYEQVAAGEYTVAMRGAGARPSSKPVLSTTVRITPGHAYTVAGMGPAKGLRLVVLSDQLSTPPGHALVRVIQASLQEHRVTVTAGGTVLARHLAFGSYTSYRPVRPEQVQVTAAGATESGAQTVTLAAGSVYSVVVLDGSGRLVIDSLQDAAGSRVIPSGGAQTGLGGTAPRPGIPVLPWLVGAMAVLAGAAGCYTWIRQRRRPATHAR
jgi:hypothetical protein